jgi:hypothetical protein
MLKAKEVKVGDWLRDVNGIYEVIGTEVGAGNFTQVQEVIFSDKPDEYWLDNDVRYLTDLEISHMDRMDVIE